MTFSSIQELKKQGLNGFYSIKELTQNPLLIPKEKGVYLVLSFYNEVKFLKEGTGGYFKGKNPNVPIAELKRNWISNALILYIGKAGGLDSKATLYSRLKQYIKFGQGKDVGHYGGRFIWQIQNSNELIVCWKELFNSEPSIVESQLIEEFSKKYTKRPFANLKD